MPGSARTEREVRAIVFDFGGVLTRSEVSEAQLSGYDALLHLPAGTLRAKLHSGEAWELASTGRISARAYWERAGLPYEALLPPEFGIFRTGVFRAEPVNEAMVRFARELGRTYRLALCSNALLDLTEILGERPDIRELFEVVVISVIVGVRKPNPAIFATEVWRPDEARQELMRVLEQAHDCHVEIIMKDISTVRYQPQRLWEWAALAMDLVQSGRT